MSRTLKRLIDCAATQRSAMQHWASGQIRAGWISTRNHPASRRFRRLDDYHMLYLVKGAGRYLDERKQATPLQPGCRVDRHPQLPHTIERHAVGSWIEFYITLSPPLHHAACTMGLLDPHRVIQHCPLTTDLLKDCLHFVDQLHTAVLCPAEMVSQLAKLLGAFVVDTQRDDSSGTQSDQLQCAAHLLADLSQQQTSLPQIARQVGMQYETFRKHFARQYDKSPQQYRIDHRIRQAQHHLLETDIRIEDLARILGYNDVFCFSRQFKAKCNMSPSQYRHRSDR